MTRVEILKTYIETITKIEKKEKKLNDICFNWNKSNQSDNEILKKIDYMQKEIDLLTIQAKNLRKEYNKIQEEDAIERQRIINNQEVDIDLKKTQAIKKDLTNQARTISVPVNILETINNMARIHRQLILELNREPSEEEIAKKMGISVDEVKEIIKISLDLESLETPIVEEDNSYFGDFIKDESSLLPEEYDTKTIEIIAGIKSKVAKKLITSEEADELILAVQNAYHNQPSTENTIRR